MANNKDYYEILGVGKKATPEEIKKAYRKLAREHHPDMVKDDDKDMAERRFKEINEAYQVLSDPQKRQMYDQFGHAGMGNGFSGQQGGHQGPFTYSYSSSGGNPFDFGEGIDPFDIFEEFFGFRGFGGSRRPKKGKNLYYEMRLEFRDIVFGIEREINVESGKMKVKIPAGARNGTEIRFSGKGMPGPDGAPSGDLYITVRVSDPEDFKVVGDDIYLHKEIDLIDAILGTEIKISVVDLEKPSGVGAVTLKIPGGTQYGSKFLVKGKGMPRVNSNSRGNAVVQVYFFVPKRLSKKQRKILEEYQSL